MLEKEEGHNSFFAGEREALAEDHNQGTGSLELVSIKKIKGNRHIPVTSYLGVGSTSGSGSGLGSTITSSVLFT